ncbi:hypothetical protein HanPSC8_Chr14g0621571 [Helianthus annuus]|nr:hypothetical protein HanPSC8_Chr14g0621571 [Helianthus annuus]
MLEEKAYCFADTLVPNEVLNILSDCTSATQPGNGDQRIGWFHGEKCRNQVEPWWTLAIAAARFLNLHRLTYFPLLQNLNLFFI